MGAGRSFPSTPLGTNGAGGAARLWPLRRAQERPSPAFGGTSPPGPLSIALVSGAACGRAPGRWRGGTGGDGRGQASGGCRPFVSLDSARDERGGRGGPLMAPSASSGEAVARLRRHLTPWPPLHRSCLWGGVRSRAWAMERGDRRGREGAGERRLRGEGGVEPRSLPSTRPAGSLRTNGAGGGRPAHGPLRRAQESLRMSWGERAHAREGRKTPHPLALLRQAQDRLVLLRLHLTP